ncbi:MAG: hypothetical protein KDA80_11945 [Planctomycetaceae bacterium]|nr:hypothetical protein [Planctomycetaceae bacterium]
MMRHVAERLTLWAGLYGVTMTILLTEGVHPSRAFVWAIVASSSKFLVVEVNRRVWRSAVSRRKLDDLLDDDLSDIDPDEF